MTAFDITQELHRRYYQQYMKIDTVYIYDWESDFWFLTRSGYKVEIEIKVTRSDFFADFKKPKHELLKSRYTIKKTGYGFYYEVNGQRCYSQRTRDNTEPDLFSNVKITERNYKTCPNKFYYCYPEGLVEPEEVPEYAGILHVGNGVTEIRRPPVLHRDKRIDWQTLAHKFYFQNITQRGIIADLKTGIESLKKEDNL